MKKFIIYSISLLFFSLLDTQAQTKIQILHTSDTHSCVEPLSKSYPEEAKADKGGYLRREVLVSDLRKQNPNTLLLDCGDFSQGSPYYNLFKGDVEVKLMNAMHYDACTIGNHEFDFGLENMARLFKLAEFPIVCCNYDFTGTPVEGLVKPYVVKECGGLRIGIFGVSPKMEGLVAKVNYGETKFLDPVEAAQPVVDKLRNEEKCDLVICLSHLGYGTTAEYDPAFIAATTGIDVVLGGHSHTFNELPVFLPNKEGRQVPLDHQGKSGLFVGCIELTVQ